MFGKIKKYGKDYFCSETCTEFNEIVISFAYGLIFGSFSYGLIWLIVFIIVYEVYVFYVTKDVPERWRFLARVGINAAALLGWILGRWLILDKTGFEFMMRD